MRRRVFYLAEGRIHLDFHFGEGRITSSSRTYTKDGRSISYQANPYLDAQKASAARYAPTVRSR